MLRQVFEPAFFVLNGTIGRESSSLYMIKKPAFAIATVSLYLLIYLVFISIAGFENIVLGMFACSPFLIVWLVYSILKYGKYSGPALDDDEWGYEDKKKEDLGFF